MTKFIRTILVAVFLLGISGSIAVAQDTAKPTNEYRIWARADGREVPVKMALVQRRGNELRLKREDNGVVIRVFMNQVSEKDRKYIAGLRKSLKPAPTGNSSPASNTNSQPAAVTSGATGSRRGSSSESIWPQFRGPGGSGIAKGSAPLEWSDSRNINWKCELPGHGTSSPVIFNDRVYLTYYDGYGLSEESPGDPSNLVQHVLCVDARGGQILWDKSVPWGGDGVPGYGSFLALHGYATGTPAVDESGVYVFFGATGLFAFDHTGNLRWQKDCGKSPRGADGWGTGTSPIIYNDTVIMHADTESTTIYAFESSSGDERWRKSYTRGGQNTRATPLIATLDGKEQLLFHSRMGTFTSLDPSTGEQHWEYEGTKNYQNPSPVTDGRNVLLLTYGQSLSLSAAGEKNWENNKGSEICSPIYHDGHLYFANEGNGVAYCIDAKTGQLVYQQRLTPSPGKLYASGVLADGRIYYVGRESGTYVVAAKPEFEQLAHNVIESDKSVFNATPAIVDGRIYVRSNTHLYCIEE